MKSLKTLLATWNGIGVFAAHYSGFVGLRTPDYTVVDI